MSDCEPVASEIAELRRLLAEMTASRDLERRARYTAEYEVCWLKIDVHYYRSKLLQVAPDIFTPPEKT
jgi:hypothetical protein